MENAKIEGKSNFYYYEEVLTIFLSIYIIIRTYLLVSGCECKRESYIPVEKADPYYFTLRRKMK